MPRGTKTCPKCKTTTGPRAFKCANQNCGFEFEIKKKAEREPVNTIVEAPKKGRANLLNLIFTPGQQTFKGWHTGYAVNKKDFEDFCPIKPVFPYTDKNIIEWINKLEDRTFMSGANKSKYAREAIEYFAGTFWPCYIKDEDNNIILNPEYQRVRRLIKENMEPYAEEVENLQKAILTARNNRYKIRK